MVSRSFCFFNASTGSVDEPSRTPRQPFRHLEHRCEVSLVFLGARSGARPVEEFLEAFKMLTVRIRVV